MATVQIRNLDDEAYATLRRRASESGRSLQEYLRLLLEESARKESVAGALQRMRADVMWAENSVTLDDIVSLQREGRTR
ncbi:plasmid stability protein [Marmoricola sp. OAE513]|uniref:FitA-like ribbon-helix-helix domain-containing protein n=1 Tax=Marmoricola sp. OAE513 TaxID=2817894 RepID=UPI001AE52A77